MRRNVQLLYKHTSLIDIYRLGRDADLSPAALLPRLLRNDLLHRNQVRCQFMGFLGRLQQPLDVAGVLVQHRPMTLANEALPSWVEYASMCMRTRRAFVRVLSSVTVARVSYYYTYTVQLHHL